MKSSPDLEKELSIPKDAHPSPHSSGHSTPYTQSILGDKEDAIREAPENQRAQPQNDNDNESKLEKVLSKISIADNTGAGLRLFFIIIAIVLSVFLVALDMTIVATAIPRITDEFNSLQDVGWYGSAFFLTVASFQSTWGKAYKFFHLKTTFITSMAIFELGSLICAVSQNSTTLIVGRAIAGAGGAGIAAGAYIILAFAAPPGKGAAFTGILGAVYAVASVVGPLLGGVFTDDLSWRWCFYINLPIGGAAAMITLAFFKAPPQAAPTPAPLKEKILSMDPLGTFVFMGAMVCLLLFLQYGGVSHSWGSSTVIGLIVGFVLIFALFIFIQHKLQERALLVPRLLKKKTTAVLTSLLFFNSGGFMILLYFLPLYFQVVSNVSAAQSGVRNLPFILGISLCTIISGIIITATGHYIPLLILGTVLTTIGNGLIYTLGTNTPSSQWIGYQALSGIGTGFSLQITMIVVQATVAPSDLSSATAIVLFFQTLTGAVFIQVAQALFSNRLIHVIPQKVPGLDPKLVVATGATELRHTFSPEQLPGVIESFLLGLKDAYILAITLAAVAAVTSVVVMAVDWRTLKEKNVPADGAA